MSDTKPEKPLNRKIEGVFKKAGKDIEATVKDLRDKITEKTVNKKADQKLEVKEQEIIRGKVMAEIDQMSDLDNASLLATYLAKSKNYIQNEDLAKSANEYMTTFLKCFHSSQNIAEIREVTINLQNIDSEKLSTIYKENNDKLIKVASSFQNILCTDEDAFNAALNENKPFLQNFMDSLSSSLKQNKHLDISKTNKTFKNVLSTFFMQMAPQPTLLFSTITPNPTNATERFLPRLKV